MAESSSQNKFELDFFSLIPVLLKKWKTIFAGALVCAAIGTVYALVASPVYNAEVVIAPRDNQAGGGAASLLTQMGGGILGGSSSLNASLDRLEILVGSPEIARRVIERNDLLPRLYPKNWDAGAGKWKKAPPNLRLAVESLRGSLEIEPTVRKRFLTVTFYASDSILARDLAAYYMEALNLAIQEETRSDADGNRAYLETQLMSTQDPILREQIQNMIAAEIGKSMLVSSKAFDVLVKPQVPLFKLKPKRKKIVVGAFIIGAILSCMAVAANQIMRERKKRA